ncbi:UNVERIFIED_CONTAM: UDP-glucose flavonoid 3-O-glucosyltransferase 6 [Sesamum calycinum]|uniref:Glycosyltransferase n=2 Tax=Sesamum calycinum TaxID=2727403 RepID=A0AAW2PAJ9_9LAMI
MSEAKTLTSLVFIPLPIISHMVSVVKLAKLLADRDERLSITILIMKLPMEGKISSLTKNPPHSRVNFVKVQTQVQHDSISTDQWMKLPKDFVGPALESQKDLVRDAVAEIMKSSSSSKIAAFVIDMFCTSMMDVANELGIPTYVFLPIGLAAVGLMLHLQSLRDDHNMDLTEYKNLDAEICVSAFTKPVPAAVWPPSVFDKESDLLDFIKRYRDTQGIIVNSFLELESHQIMSLSNDHKIPPIYPLGPILQLGGDQSNQENQNHTEIIGWLDKQPHSSVVYLCFGSNGSVDGEQVKEIAVALENSGYRFLWSLRKPPPRESFEFPGEYENPEDVLPKGFLKRTAVRGKVIGWAPQMAVLSHTAVGGFVSHSGWNSTLESLWWGVPMAVWPLAAEQQANAFLLVKEIEMAVEIKIDYNKDNNVIVGSEMIETAIRQLMDPENGVRLKVRALKEKSRLALMEGGSSFNYMKRFIENVMDDVS